MEGIGSFWIFPRWPQTANFSFISISVYLNSQIYKQRNGWLKCQGQRLLQNSASKLTWDQLALAFKMTSATNGGKSFLPPGKNQSACWIRGSIIATICRETVAIISVMFLKKQGRGKGREQIRLLRWSSWGPESAKQVEESWDRKRSLFSFLFQEAFPLHTQTSVIHFLSLLPIEDSSPDLIKLWHLCKSRCFFSRLF